MPRRGVVVKRKITPDVKYDSKTLAAFTNKLMRRGKKSTAERIIYTALDNVEKQAKKNPLEVFEQALKNATPLLQVKPRRVGGATYQVPVEVKGERGLSTAVKWMIASARARSGKSMAEKLAAEIVDASQGQGATIKKREDTHKMAEANRAFAHYRW